ncbi:DUF4426 domain-containing protein [Halopseudomonas salina]|uniref:DUF4426 domain-containing protein n=1 Tax=Halopseudomonas salina TaxID=1323744 RepID=A0ABQ1PEQ4_9GAMM|nr:DUF4426 domain-containing protein [Halopseudomonas salina]GGC95769.1 hypothetical protein GCM10007418_14130 [Halopseudomonas salina]
MLRNLLCTLMLVAAPLAMAQDQSPKRFGDIIVYFSPFNSSYVAPQVAANVGLERAPDKGVLNIAVQRETPDGAVPVDARVTGTVKTLIEQETPLNFIRVKEEDALYFVANYGAPTRSILRFEIDIQPEEGGAVHTLNFQKEFFPDE